MFSGRIRVGLDVHARSVVAPAIAPTGELSRERLVPSDQIVLEWLARLPGPVAVTYEAGSTEFGLARAMAAASVRRKVAAPLKLAPPAGDRVKTGSRLPTPGSARVSAASCFALADGEVSALGRSGRASIDEDLVGGSGELLAQIRGRGDDERLKCDHRVGFWPCARCRG